MTQHGYCKHWKHCYTDRDLTLFCYLVHGIPLMKSSKEDGFRFVMGTVGHRWIPLTESQQLRFIFCISLAKRLNKRSDCQQFEKIGCSLWRYCNVLPNWRQGCNFCSKVTTNPCDKKMISTLGTLLSAIESVVVVPVFQLFNKVFFS